MLAPHTRIREYPRKRALFWAGDAAKDIHVVLGGRVKLYVPDAVGRQQVVRVASRGEILGLVPLFDDSPVYVTGGEVIVPATVMEISMTAARQLISESQEFSGKIMKALSSEVRANLETRHALSLPARKRVAWLLLQLSRQMVGKGGSFRFPYDKGVAAAELCMSPETFSRSLSQLRDAGVICKDGNVSIDDFGRLGDFVRGQIAGEAAQRDAGTVPAGQGGFDFPASRYGEAC